MNKWDNYFMGIAELSANLSKDPNTHVGAVIVQDKRIKSTGFNGAPKTFNDDLVPWDSTDNDALIDQKNTYMCHAEVNAVLNYDGNLRNLDDATMYVTVSPCSRCAVILAQAGIKKIIYKSLYHRENETNAAKKILKTCGVDLIAYDSLEDNNGN